MVNQKKKIEKNAFKLARKCFSNGRYRPTDFTGSSLNKTNEVPAGKSFNFPSLKGIRRLQENNSNSRTRKNLSHIMSGNFETSRLISTNPSQDNMLDQSKNFESRYVSPNSRTLVDSIMINNSRTTLFSNINSS